MSAIQKLSNAGQLYKMLFLGGFLVPVWGLVSACMAFFVTLPPASPATNPVFRICMVVVSFVIAGIIVWYVQKTYPKEIWLGDEVEVHYLNKTLRRPYADIEKVTFDDREGHFHGGGVFPLKVKETIFTLSFRGGPIVNVSVVPGKNKPFFDELLRRQKTPRAEGKESKQMPAALLEQLAYNIAYSILPHYVFDDFDRFIATCKQNPQMASVQLLFMACQAVQIRPPDDEWKLFLCHHGNFEKFEYVAIEYPKPRPMVVNETDPFKAFMERKSLVLPPYFSVVLFGSDAAPRCFVLGQSPMGGCTTVREVTSDGVNSNLGQGPEPKLELFLEAIGQRLEKRSA